MSETELPPYIIPKTSTEPLPGCEGCRHVATYRGPGKTPGCGMLMVYVSPCWVREQEDKRTSKKS